METHLSHRELQHYTNLWCKQQGFKNRELDNELTADNLVLLVIVKQDYWQHMDKSSKAVWNGLHSMLIKSYPFKEKHLKSVEKIIEQATKAKLKDIIIKAKIKKLKSDI
jgi:hypothetical protein